ncbi:hypothetical protein [Dyadobacter sp. OTU695]|uniref:hypothetical protein n=1 Tax=Dyadobacter sp. OTU695 TaxID=3043860 RepID=UPI00313C8B83
MKKLFLLLLPGMMLLAGNAEAQFDKGTRHWGATISFSGNTQVYKSNTGTEAKLGNQSLSPSIQFGKFYKDNTMFGLRFTPFFSFNKQSQDGWGNDYDIHNNFMSLTLSPFIRRYKSLGPKWAIFLQPGLNLSYLRGATKGTDTEKEHNDGFGAGAYILPGIVYRITPRFALEADANVLSLNLNYSNLNSINSFGFNAGFTSNIQQYFSIRASWYLTTSN